MDPSASLKQSEIRSDNTMKLTTQRYRMGVSIKANGKPLDEALD